MDGSSNIVSHIASCITVSKRWLSKVPIVDGQLICIKDEVGMFYDMNGERHTCITSEDRQKISVALTSDDIPTIVNLVIQELPNADEVMY